MAHRASTQREVMTELWAQVSSPAMRPFVTLFFEVFGLVAQGTPGTEGCARASPSRGSATRPPPPRVSACRRNPPTCGWGSR